MPTHVDRMLDLVDKAYAEPISLQTMAAALNRQPAYLGCLFRREIGMSVHDWVTRVRLDRAAALIRAGMGIEAVSLRVGYRSKKNFYRQFRRHYARTPLQYGRVWNV